jgi:hypothetical protein
MPGEWLYPVSGAGEATTTPLPSPGAMRSSSEIVKALVNNEQRKQHNHRNARNNHMHHLLVYLQGISYEACLEYPMDYAELHVTS